MPTDKNGNYFLYAHTKDQKAQQGKLDAENAKLVKAGKSSSKKSVYENLSKKAKPSKQAESDANMAAIKRNGGMAEYKAATKVPVAAFPKKQQKGVVADRKRVATSIKRAK